MNVVLRWAINPTSKRESVHEFKVRYSNLLCTAQSRVSEMESGHVRYGIVARCTEARRSFL